MIGDLSRHGIKLGLVTSALLGRVKSTVPAGFLENFQAIVTGEDTKEGKPSPMPYFAGAKKLGVDASDCVVVENAPLGITSAKRAGAYCIALETTLAIKFLEEADSICRSFEDLSKSPVIRELMSSKSRSAH